MTVAINDLGLPYNATTDLLTNPAVIVYGYPKTGKSTDVACAFQSAYFITTDPGVLHPYRVRRAQRPELGLCDIGPGAQNEVTIPFTVMEQGQTFQFIEQVLARIYALVQAGRFPYRAVVYDEFNVMLDKMWPTVRAQHDPRNRQNDPWGAMDTLACNLLRGPKSVGLAVGAVMHDTPPSYNEDGSLKYCGGPQTPIGRMRRSLVAAADVALRITLEKPGLALPLKETEPAKDTDKKSEPAPPPPLVVGAKQSVLRRYHTEPSAEWLGGVRGGFELEPMVDLGLDKVLAQVGMSVT